MTGKTRQQVDADAFFKTVPIGKDALAFLVNRDNSVYNISTEQVHKSFSGEHINWSRLGGGEELYDTA